MRRSIVEDDHDAMGIASSIATIIGSTRCDTDFTEAQLIDIKKRAEAIARWAKRELASLK